MSDNKDILNGFEKEHVAKDEFVTKFDKNATVVNKQNAHADLLVQKHRHDLAKDSVTGSAKGIKDSLFATEKKLKSQTYDPVAREGYVAGEFGDDSSAVMDDAKLRHDQTYSVYQSVSKVVNFPENHRAKKIEAFERKEIRASKAAEKKLNKAKDLYVNAKTVKETQEAQLAAGKKRLSPIELGKQAKLNNRAERKLASARKKAGKAEKYAQKAAKKSAKSAKHATVRSFFSGTRGGFIKVLAASLGGFLAAAGVIVVAIALVTTIISAAAALVGNTGSLDGVQAQVAMYLRAKGFSDAAIAGIMGNLDNEGSWDPGSNEVGGGGFGLFQFDGGNKTSFFAHCTANGLTPTDVTVQLDYVFNHPTEDIISSWDDGRYFYTGAYNDLIGVGGWDGTIYADKNEFKNADDVVKATASFMMCYERCRSGVDSHFDRRVESAQNFYLQLQSGGLINSATTEEGQRIVDACYTTPATKEGECAMWVSNVIQNAGFPRPGGDARDFYWNYCHSDNLADLQPGMVIAVPSNDKGLGEIYGHVGIYIGDGKVASCIGYVYIESLDSFRSWNETNRYTCKWGWAI